WTDPALTAVEQGRPTARRRSTSRSAPGPRRWRACTRRCGSPGTGRATPSAPACCSTRGTSPGRRRSAAPTGSCVPPASPAGGATCRCTSPGTPPTPTSAYAAAGWRSRSTAGCTRTTPRSSSPTAGGRTPSSGPAGASCASPGPCCGTTRGVRAGSPRRPGSADAVARRTALRPSWRHCVCRSRGALRACV
ncbi:MAG: hypothetical protein AVDCRST_MAG48-621, partial [uncultured Friedmanniella sp.]